MFLLYVDEPLTSYYEELGFYIVLIYYYLYFTELDVLQSFLNVMETTPTNLEEIN